MGLILLFITIIIIVTLIFYVCSLHNKTYALVAAVVSTALFTTLSGLIVGISFSSYADLKTQRATIEQYVTSIKLYSDMGVKEFANSGTARNEITDLKYHEYQSRMARFISSLRYEITYYNEVLVSKRVYNECFFFGALIIAPPEDFKELKMSDLINQE
jgi:hypothetical protein